MFVPAWLALQAVHWIGFLLDDVFFRGYRKVDIREPLFVVGMPRSGTTFLQRVLAEDRQRHTTLRLWELLLAPSVTERKIWLGLGRLDAAVGRPARRLIDGLQGALFRFMDEVHPVRLEDPEEDYLLLLPVFACFLLVVPFPYYEPVWQLARFDELPRRKRTALVAFYRSCLQRHLYATGEGRAVLSKNPSFTPMLGSLVEAFPDARFVVCVRDPREAVPSQLSSLRSGARLFGWDVSEPRIRDRFVEMLSGHLEHALAQRRQMPDNRCVFVELPNLSGDVPGTVLGIYERFGWTPSPGFRDALERWGARSDAHRSRHRYDLEQFDLTEETVMRRFGIFFEHFGEPAGVDGESREPGDPERPVGPRSAVE